jgi:hypothetical protein
MIRCWRRMYASWSGFCDRPPAKGYSRVHAILAPCSRSGYSVVHLLTTIHAVGGGVKLFLFSQVRLRGEDPPDLLPTSHSWTAASLP